MSDEHIIKWLQHWLSSWDFVRAGTYKLEFLDLYGHLYEIEGADLRACVAKAVKRYPDSAKLLEIPGEYTGP